MPTNTSTIVFADVVGSGPVPPHVGEDAGGARSALRHALEQVVAAHGGRVVSTSGPALMATFDSAVAAVAGAVAMQQQVAHQFTDVRLRVGAAAGDVRWEDGRCEGPPVETAARLQAHAEGSQILVSGLVRHLAGDRGAATFKPLGPIPLEGLTEPVDSFEAAWEPRDPGRVDGSAFTIPCPPAISAVPPFAFVGREAERQALAQAWAEAAAGERRAVLIGGEAGAGKTRLAFEFARRCAAEGATVLLGACDTELALPYQPWVQVLDHLVGSMPADVAAAQAGELAEVLLLVPHLEGVVPAPRRVASADPETERYRLFTAVDGLLTNVARLRPTIVVIDDLQWASAQTLALLRHIARSATASRLLVIATFRDTGDEMTEPLAGCLADLRRTHTTSRLALAGLDHAAVERFVAGAVGHELDADLQALAATLASHTAGNAFYLSELWRHLSASRVVTQVGGRWQVRPAAAGVGVPDSVREVVADRLTRLSPAARHLVELAAVAGQRVELRVLDLAADASEGERGWALDELVEAKLLTEAGGVLPSYQFTHAIVRDTVERSIASSNKARLHQRLAQTIEAVYEADRRPVLAQLARHFGATAPLGGSAKAVYYGRRAASQAMRAVAYEEAISHLLVALELSPAGSPELVDILLELGTARSRHGLHREAMATFADAFRAALEQGLVAQAAEAATGFDLAVQTPGLPGGPAVEMVSQALALLGEEASPLRSRLQASLARALTLAGRHEEAVAVGEEALAAARHEGDVDALMAGLQSALLYSSDPRRILSEARELRDLARGREDLTTYEYAKVCEIRALVTLGMIEEFRRELDECREIAERGRLPFYRFIAMGFEVMLAVIDGRFADAEAFAERAHDFAESIGSENREGAYGLQMYVIRREQGRVPELIPILRLAAQMDSQPSVWRPGLAAILADAGMMAESRSVFEALAPGDFAAVPRDAMWPTCLGLLAEVCVALGDRQRATTLYRELEPYRGLTIMAGFTVCLGPAERHLGNLAALRGRRPDAERHFAAALHLAEQSGSRPWIARVQHDWAMALGDRPEQLALALATAADLGMRSVAGPSRPGPTQEEEVTFLPDGLSLREIEVLRLVAAGLSNKDIGERLSISHNTAANHVRAILQKTASANRAEATAYAAHHGLLDPFRSESPRPLRRA